MKRKLTIDWFAGGGGASTGIRKALGRPIDIALNHDALACAMHRVNHPETRHIQGCAWDHHPLSIATAGSVGDAWFSPDCTFHSKARGGVPFRDVDFARRLRGLPNVPLRWAREVRPDRIYLENVEEMALWGPIDRKTSKPCPRRRGAHFRKWCRQFQELGYTIDMRELKAHEYGAPTSRKRLFIIARCDGYEPIFPEETHGPGLAPYRTAAECIDWDDLGVSIFGRERELAEATKRRLARGTMRFAVNNPRPFIVPITRRGHDRVHSIDDPLRTITTSKGGEFTLVTPFVERYFSSGAGNAIDQPLGTIMGDAGHCSLVSAFVAGLAHGDHKERAGGRCHGIDEPVRTIHAGGGNQAVVAAFLAQHNTGMTGHMPNKPMSTIVGKVGPQALVTLHLSHEDRERAHRVAAFVMSYYGTDQAPRIDGPAPTVRTKDHLALVTVHGDPIVDIRMRMFKARELYRAQSFEDSYIIDRGIDEDGCEISLNKTDQVRMCGNSVPPVMSEAIVRVNHYTEARYKQRVYA